MFDKEKTPIGSTYQVKALNNLLARTRSFTSKQTWADYKAKPDLTVGQAGLYYYEKEFVTSEAARRKFN